MHPPEHGVEDADRASVVEGLPKQDGDDRRDDDRQVRERAVEAATAAHLAHQHGRHERYRVAEDEREQREVRRVLDRDREQRVSDHGTEVVEPNPRRRGDEVCVLQRHHDRLDDRVPGKRTEYEQQREQENQRREAAAPHPRQRGAPLAVPLRERRSLYLDLTAGCRRGHRVSDLVDGGPSPAVHPLAPKLASVRDRLLRNAVCLAQQRGAA